jgi:hypothetical protein
MTDRDWKVISLVMLFCAGLVLAGIVIGFLYHFTHH